MNKDFKIKFGLRIKELRIANNMTQEQLAEKLDMERVNLAKIEAGNHIPSSENLEKIANIFNTNLADLFQTNHFKNKETLINEITSTLNDFELNKIQYVYKAIMNLKNL